MNKSRLKGAWNQIKGNMRQRAGRETGADDQMGRGQDEEIIGKAQSTTGRVQDKVKDIFKNP